MAAEGASGGAYGFSIRGVPERNGLIEAPRHWPALALSVEVGARQQPVEDRVDDDIAIVRLRAGGFVTVRRTPASATFSLPTRPREEALVHPHLASAAAVCAHWLGRESFHAGAFAAGGGVWALLGDKGAGKSSMLASLALAGVPVVTDDLLVLDGLTAFAGPRSIDLRADAAATLRAGESLGVIGQRERWRLALPSAAAELPFRGWVLLEWDEKTSVTPLRGSDRLRALTPHRALRIAPRRPEALIELSALPLVALARPRDWGSARDGLELLLDVTGAP